RAIRTLASACPATCTSRRSAAKTSRGVGCPGQRRLRLPALAQLVVELDQLSGGKQEMAVRPAGARRFAYTPPISTDPPGAACLRRSGRVARFALVRYRFGKLELDAATYTLS